MKLLVNLCAHDGIISHYAGVGTIVRRYVEVIRKILSKKSIDYHLNLFTLEFNEMSMGYNKELWDYSNHKLNIGKYTSIEMSIIWGLSSIILIYFIKPFIDLYISIIPKYITYILIFLFCLDFIMTILIKTKLF